MDNKERSFGGDDSLFLEPAHLNTGGFAGKPDHVGNDTVCGGEIDS